MALATLGGPPFTAAATAATAATATATATATDGRAVSTAAAVVVDRAVSASPTDVAGDSALVGVLGIDFVVAASAGTSSAGPGSAGVTPSAPIAAATAPTATAATATAATGTAPPGTAPPATTPASAPPAATWEPAPAGPTPTPSATASGPPTTADPDSSFAPVLAAEFRSYLATRPGAVSVALYDRTSGLTVDVTNSTRTGWETASTVKLDILTALLTKTGESGQLPASQLRLAKPMISVSDNASASALWRQAGSQSGMNAFFRAFGMTATTAGGSGAWGLTKTTAYDQLRVLRAVSYPGLGLSANAMATATSLLGTVVGSQRWGLTAGVPAGVSVEIKNGWLPYGGGWVINSLAHVHGAGKDYIMAAYTRDSRTMGIGVETISGLSRLAWQYVPAAPVLDPNAPPEP
ncbi:MULTISPECIES: serine hydrolase [Pseudofrankia]|uniref:serine hydrolase n=1 Tax=Pseudofrankia TaxID=2994363 RepID=UPI000234BF09|nr:MULTISPECIES: serine hydrolase [Pseudofrankia]